MLIDTDVGFGALPSLRLHTLPGDQEALTRPCAPVTLPRFEWAYEVDLVTRMFTVLDRHDGLGLAAPQVGLPWRLFLMQDPYSGIRWTFWNPRIVERSDVHASDREGCLSIPGRMVIVRRPTSIVLEFNRFGDEKGTAHQFHGLAARCVQHEVDHLDGILITDPRRS